MFKKNHEITNGQFVLECMHKAYRSIHEGVSKNGQYPNHTNEGTVSNYQEEIKDYINSDKPFMMARFGSVELYAFINWLQVNNKLIDSEKYSPLKYVTDQCFPNWFSIGTRNGMSNNAGFFPPTDECLEKWGKMVFDNLKDLDVLLTWQKGERYIQSYLKGKQRILNSEIYNPYYYKNPWSEALRGKRVLVVSPFAKTIESQYFNNRDKLFKDKRVLPEFESLQTVKAYNVLGGNNHYSDIHNWFDALDIMEDEISSKDFDVALIGCGAYAFNLAAYIKQMGKKAITLCGSLQCLFGIYGNRYEKAFKESGLLNEYWVRPGDDEKPEGYQKVENGAYW